MQKHVPNTFEDIEEIRKAMTVQGSHWWSERTMAFFGTAVQTDLLGADLFVTRENHPASADTSMGAGGFQKRWTIRRAIRPSGQRVDIINASQFGEFESLNDAIDAAKSLAVDTGRLIDVCREHARPVYEDSLTWAIDQMFYRWETAQDT